MKNLPFICAVWAIALGGVSADPLAIVFPYQYVANIDTSKFNEPSGLVFHPQRGTIFAVGDNGDLCELGTDGGLVKEHHLSDADLEGITCDPSTGLLYVAVEGEEKILEIDPEDFSVRREFAIERIFEGKALLKEGGQGIEGLTFVPEAGHPEGGVFYVANQAFELGAEEDLSVICELVLPLRSSEEGAQVSIRRYFAPGFIDISGLHYDAEADLLVLISDAVNAIFYVRRTGELIGSYALPGDNQEGIAIDAKGNLYIAQDSGGIVKFEPRR
jgi:uncharacterized protein YjiK